MIDIENVKALKFILTMMPHEGLDAVELDSPAYRDMLSDEPEGTRESLDRNVRLILTFPTYVVIGMMAEAGLSS